MRPPSLAALLFAGSLALACGGLGGEQVAAVDHPRVYDGHGLQFSYPSNWSTSDSTSVESGVQVVAVEVTTPGDALVIVQDYQPALPLGAEWFARTYQEELVKAMGQMMGGVFTIEEHGAFAVQRTVAGRAADGFRTAFDVMAFGERLPHTVEVYVSTLPARTVVVYLQVADEDHDKVAPGFELILDSLVTAPAGAAAP